MSSIGVVGDHLPDGAQKKVITDMSAPFKQKFGYPPPQFAQDGYSASLLLFEAIKKAQKCGSRQDPRRPRTDDAVDAQRSVSLLCNRSLGALPRIRLDQCGQRWRIRTGTLGQRAVGTHGRSSVAGMLRIEGLSRRFGGVYAVQNVNITVQKGELRGIIGPNGAGKSTLFNLIAGHLHANSGRLMLGDERVDGLAAHERAARGIAIVHQGASIFKGMTVLENVMLGVHRLTRHGFLAAAIRSPLARRENAEMRTIASRLLDEVGLTGLGDRMAEELPLGQQRSLQLARALASDPCLLLLDEPASGLREVERERFAELIERLRARGLTVLLVEHDVPLVTRLSDRITVLNLGRVIADDTPAVIREDPQVISAYLGTPETT